MNGSIERTDPSGERLHALDAVRGLALLLGIVFHATASFLVTPQQAWIVTDQSASTTLTLTFYVLHIFRMATFFFIAGFFAHLMFHRRGPRGFVRDRLRRIGLPLLVGWPLLVVPLIGCLIWGAWVMNGGTLPPTPPADPNAPPLAFPLTHLWFLYLLLWFYAITLLVRRLVERVDAHGRARARLDAVVGALVRNPLGLLVLAAPSCAALLLVPGWRPWFGIPTPDDSLLPNVAAFTAFGSAFAFGWFVHRRVELLAVFESRWLLNLAIGVAATVAALTRVGIDASPTIAARDLQMFGYAAAYAVAVWSLTFAFVGFALRYLANFSARRRYLADASYWLYLIHLPLVLALQIVVSQWPWPWWAKFPLILAIVFPLMLASYRYWVRGTFIGAVLNGRRYPRTLAASRDLPQDVPRVEPTENAA